MSEEVIFEEPSKDIKIGDVNITLVNELIQTINEAVNVTFTSDASMDAIMTAFETCGSFTYGDDTYEGYSIVKSFEMEVDNIGQTVYRIELEKPVEEAGLTEDQTFAIKCAVSLMSNEQALQCVSVFPTWESFIGKALPKLDENGNVNRIQYGEKLYEVRQDISVVLEHQPPGIDTAALYQVIDLEHAGTYEDPIPYDQMMEVFNGKYYLEDGIIYKCIRDSGQPLYATCASLVGNYFEVATEEE